MPILFKFNQIVPMDPYRIEKHIVQKGEEIPKNKRIYEYIHFNIIKNYFRTKVVKYVFIQFLSVHFVVGWLLCYSWELSGKQFEYCR